MYVCVTKFWVHSPFWSVATIAQTRPSANQISTWYVLPDFHTTFSIVAHIKTKHTARLYFEHCSCMKTVQQHKTTHITMIRSYKLVANHSLRHPKRPPHPQTSIATVLRHTNQLPAPPTARISLHRRVQTADFHYTAHFLKTSSVYFNYSNTARPGQ